MREGLWEAANWYDWHNTRPKTMEEIKSFKKDDPIAQKVEFDKYVVFN